MAETKCANWRGRLLMLFPVLGIMPRSGRFPIYPSCSDFPCHLQHPEIGPAMSKSVRAGGDIWISASSVLDVGHHSDNDFVPDRYAIEFSGLAEIYEIA